MRLLSFALALFVIPSVARAEYWSAKLSPDGNRVHACIWEKGTIDERLRAVQAADRSCALKTDVVFTALGFYIRCSNGAGLLSFRHERDCLLFQGSLNAGRRLDTPQIAPPGTRSPNFWATALEGCLGTGISAKAVSDGVVQKVASYCECTAAWAGKLKQDSDALSSRKSFVATVKQCGRQHLGAVASDALADAIFDTLVARAGLAAKSTASKTSEATAQVTTMNSTYNAGTAPLTAEPKPQPPVITRGASYADVMKSLQGFTAKEKHPYGDYLDVKYSDPPLLAYPDAGGTCVLTFNVGRLLWCVGCDPARFRCQQ